MEIKKTAKQKNTHVLRKTTCINCMHAHMYTFFNKLHKKFKVKKLLLFKFFYQTDLSVLNIRQSNICQPFLTVFFIYYLAAARPTLGHNRGEALLITLLITAFTYFDPIVTGSLVAIFPKVWLNT